MSVVDTLLRAQTGRDVVEKFCPFAQSLEWDISQAYLRGRGSRGVHLGRRPTAYASISAVTNTLSR